MKTKILLVALFATLFGFASTMKAQQVLGFTDVYQYSEDRVDAKIYCTSPVTVKFAIATASSSGNPTFTFRLGSETIVLNTSTSQGVTVTLQAGYNTIYGYYTGAQFNSYPKGSIILTTVVSGNAVIDQSKSFLYFGKR